MAEDGGDLREYCQMWQWNQSWTLSTKAYYCKRCLENLNGNPCKHPEMYVGNVEAIKPKTTPELPDSDRVVEE